MSVFFARFYFIFTLFLSLLFKGNDAWTGEEPEVNQLVKISADVMNDLVRKGQAVWMYKLLFQPYKSYAVGERVYIIRARFAEMMRMYLRNQQKRNLYDENTLIRNALLLQGRAQSMYNLRDELLVLDEEISYSLNYLGTPRFGHNNCHVTGPPCDIVPMEIGDYGRRSRTSKKFGSTDEALKLMHARRDFIKNKYKPDKFPRPIDIRADINRTLGIKFTVSTGARDVNTDVIDLAPDFVD